MGRLACTPAPVHRHPVLISISGGEVSTTGDAAARRRGRGLLNSGLSSAEFSTLSSPEIDHMSRVLGVCVRAHVCTETLGGLSVCPTPGCAQAVSKDGVPVSILP